MPGKLPPIGESVKSGNRMSALEAEELKAMKPRRKMPTPGESVKSGNRISAQEAAEMKAMKMKKGGKIKMRKYADGGLVVSRGGRDTSGLRLGMMDDEPAGMAAAAMAANEDVAARPTDAELMAANLAAVRRREAAQTAPKSRAAPAPRAAAPSLTAADRQTMREVISTPMEAPKPRAQTAKTDDARTRLARQIMRERESSFTARPVSMTEALEIADRQMARGAAKVDRTPAFQRNRSAVLDRVSERSRQNAAREAAMAARKPEDTPWYRPLPPARMKDGGPVKSGACKRGSDNMAMMAKALKGKK
jgi:hypothetical protein